MRRFLLGAFVGTTLGLVGLVLLPNGLATAAPQALEIALQSAIDRLPLLNASAKASPPDDPSLQPFWEAWDYLEREYYEPSGVDPQKLSQAALRGMVSSIGDPYTTYLDPQHRELSDAELRGSFQGIGVQVETVDDQIRIVSPLSGSPGERAGLRPGDVIQKVDGQSVSGVGLGEAIRLIRGPRGASVTLTIQRSDQPPFDVSIVRDEIRVQAVQGEIRPDGVGYIKISLFPAGVSGQLRRTIDQMRTPGPIGWVLDLRGNPGGTLDGAIGVASQFLDDGVVLYEQRRDGQREEIRRQGSASAVTGPVAVLVDKGSASAAEIVAGALQANGRATLVGEQTFGKGLVQVVHRLTDGSALRLTIARWFPPSGVNIQAVGLTPEIAIGADSDADAALSQAVAYVQTQYSLSSTVGVGNQAAPASGVAVSGQRAEAEETAALLDPGERESSDPWGLA
ncbi:MAG TPA: S41 family peptidase [Chloroflexota bacterium]